MRGEGRTKFSFLSSTGERVTGWLLGKAGQRKFIFFKKEKNERDAEESYPSSR